MSDDRPSDPAGEPFHNPQALRHRLKRILITGLVLLVPVTLTTYILVAVFRAMDGIFAPVIDRAIGSQLPGVHIPGLGLLLTILVIFLLGWLSTNVVGRSIIQVGERLISRIPVAKSIYAATKGVLEAVSQSQAEAFKRVVLIEYPKANIFAVAFVTGNARWPGLSEAASDLLLVFVPTTPNPTSGFLLLVPRREAIETSISVEEGIRMVISGGILLPAPPHRLNPPAQPPGPVRIGAGAPPSDDSASEVG